MDIVAVLTKAVQEQQRITQDHQRVIREQQRVIQDHQRVIREQQGVIQEQRSVFADLSAKVDRLERRLPAQ